MSATGKVEQLALNCLAHLDAISEPDRVVMRDGLAHSPLDAIRANLHAIIYQATADVSQKHGSRKDAVVATTTAATAGPLANKRGPMTRAPAVGPFWQVHPSATPTTGAAASPGTGKKRPAPAGEAHRPDMSTRRARLRESAPASAPTYDDPTFSLAVPPFTKRPAAAPSPAFSPATSSSPASGGSGGDSAEPPRAYNFNGSSYPLTLPPGLAVPPQPRWSPAFRAVYDEIHDALRPDVDPRPTPDRVEPFAHRWKGTHVAIDETVAALLAFRDVYELTWAAGVRGDMLVAIQVALGRRRHALMTRRRRIGKARQ